MNDRTLETSNRDNYMGKPLQPGRMKEALHNNDFRRGAQAMHYPNLLHYDTAERRFGKLVAARSFAVFEDDGDGATPACVGRIPGSQLIFGGDEWWSFGPRTFAGDMIVNDRISFDYAVKESKFAGPTCFQRGDNNYFNQAGELVTRHRSTGIRSRKDLAVEMGSLPQTEHPRLETTLATAIAKFELPRRSSGCPQVDNAQESGE